jgi:hypothetical protein
MPATLPFFALAVAVRPATTERTSMTARIIFIAVLLELSLDPPGALPGCISSKSDCIRYIFPHQRFYIAPHHHKNVRE